MHAIKIKMQSVSMLEWSEAHPQRDIFQMWCTDNNQFGSHNMSENQ